MMHNSVKNLLLIQDQIKKINPLAKIIAVTKTFDDKAIMPLVSYGHLDFGENKVQEAINKWTVIKSKNYKIKLHMIGRLQVNKVKYVVPLFDYIHSLDNLKLAQKISLEQKKTNRQLKIFIQINIGNEIQKGGIKIADLQNFYLRCVNEFKLDIVGLMCIPPESSDTNLYFKKMLSLNKSIGLNELSMGMSADYLEAVKFGSSFVRVGSRIFGSRT